MVVYVSVRVRLCQIRPSSEMLTDFKVMGSRYTSRIPFRVLTQNLETPQMKHDDSSQEAPGSRPFNVSTSVFVWYVVVVPIPDLIVHSLLVLLMLVLEHSLPGG